MVQPLRAALATLASPRMAAALHERMIVAGTFDRLHAGHHAMFHLAFAHGRDVEIWVSSR